MFRTQWAQCRKKGRGGDPGGGESGSCFVWACCEQDGTPRGEHRPTSSGREALQRPVMRNCQASSQRGPGLGLCARGGPAVPASLLRGLCQASSPSSFTLHGGFVKGTIRHSEETTQLPPSLPENKTAPLCANDPPLPGRLPAKGKWRGGRAPLCGNPGDGVLMSCPQLQAEHAVPGMLLPPCGKGLSLGF